MGNSVSRAYEILRSYDGQNNQIRYYKSLYDKGKLILEDFGVEYILRNHDYEPIEVNKTVGISSDFGEKLREKHGLDFTPEKIKISRVIGEMGKSYHCYVKYRQSVDYQLMYVQKRCILDRLVDTDWKSMEVDFDRFDRMTESLGRKLKEHQKEGAKFMLANKKCILADEMGTGKTITATISALAGGFKKILVITTASLKTTWKKDVLLYEDEQNVEIVSGSDWKVGNRFTITNYDIIQNFYKVPEEPVYEIEEIRDHEGNLVETLRVPVMVKSKSTGKMVQKMQKSRKKADIMKALDESPLFQSGFDCVIIDEAQKLSNNTSIRYKTISDMLRRMAPKAVFLLTGTPLTNRPINLYHILKLIDADVTEDYRYYVRRYCGGKEMHLKDGRTIMKMGDATNLDELREKIKDVYIRRLASETGEMVEKRISRRYYDLNASQRAEYDRLWDEYQEAQADAGREDTEEYRQLVEGMLVRQYLAKEMTANTISLVDDLVEDGEKVVVITTFQDEMDILKEYYGNKCVTYNGSMTAKQKDKAQDAFNNDSKIKVFIGQIIACGVGLSLPSSHIVVFNSYSWVAADNRQSESRVHRLTQTKDVECIYQLFTDSVSQDMFDKVLFKEYLMDTVIKSETEKKGN